MSKKKIFLVSQTKTAYVFAKDEYEAVKVFHEAAREYGDDGFDTDVDVPVEVKSVDVVPEHWLDSLPFGDQKERGDRYELTIKQILDGEE